MNIKITGTGSYIPKIIQKNEAFQQHSFLNIDGSEIPSSNEVIVEKLKPSPESQNAVMPKSI